MKVTASFAWALKVWSACDIWKQPRLLLTKTVRDKLHPQINSEDQALNAYVGRQRVLGFKAAINSEDHAKRENEKWQEGEKKKQVDFGSSHCEELQKKRCD